MRLALIVLVILPLSFAASVDVDKRFIQQLLGGFDILDLAKQFLTQFGCDETEAQCERNMCSGLLNPIDHNNALITGIVCAAVCKEPQVLAKNFGTGTSAGIDPCAGGIGGGLLGGRK